jgi:ATP-dependent Zn protease
MVQTGPTDDLEEAMTWLQPWVDRARTIVREQRDAIETVAAELLTAERLERDEIVALVERSKTDPLRLVGHLAPTWRGPEPD